MLTLHLDELVTVVLPELLLAFRHERASGFARQFSGVDATE
jgi:hypothetical protein